MQSKATSVEQYLLEQDSKKRDGLEILLRAVRKNIQPGFVETMRWGMISFEVPLELSGPTYNSQPLNYIGLAVQKHHYSVYLMGLYMDPEIETEFRRRWAAAGLKLDVGKGCVRFNQLEKADLETIGWAASLLSPEEYCDRVAAARGTRS